MSFSVKVVAQMIVRSISLSQSEGQQSRVDCVKLAGRKARFKPGCFLYTYRFAYIYIYIDIDIDIDMQICACPYCIYVHIDVQRDRERQSESKKARASESEGQGGGYSMHADDLIVATVVQGLAKL